MKLSDELYLFNEGRNFQAYRLLGAHPDAGSLEHRPARGLAVGRAGDHALEGVLGIPGSGQIEAHGIGSWWVARASGRCAAFARCIALATPTPLIRAVPGNARGSP